MYPAHFLYRGRELAPEALAVETPRRRFSHGELLATVEALAAGFQALDPRPHSRVAICGFNSLEHLLALLAVLLSGKQWIPLNPRNAKGELDAILATTEAGVVVLDEDCSDRLTGGNWRLVHGKGSEASGAGDGIWGLIERHWGQRPERGVLPLDATQAIKFTGGSTGRPKGVLQPYRAWNTCAVALASAFSTGPRDRFLLAAPITHGTGCFLLPVLGAGGSLILTEAARPGDVIDALAHRGVTMSYMPPTLIYKLLDEGAAAAAPFPALRQLVYSGAPMPIDRVREVREALGPVLATAYGQTEAPQAITVQPAEAFADEALHASVGRAGLLTELAVMDAAGRLLPAGETGEVVARGDLLMSGYLEQPELTAETIVDGWLHTGDIGVIDDSGRLFLKDRLRDVIISGGFNVYPSDVEAALGSHPAVRDCVVFGLPDRKWGEAVQAAVQFRPDAKATPAELIAFAKERVGSVKAPKAIHVFEELPRSPVGKVLRREARESVARALESSDAEA